MQAKNVSKSSLPNYAFFSTLDTTLSLRLYAARVFFKDFQLTPPLKSNFQLTPPLKSKSLKYQTPFVAATSKVYPANFQSGPFLCDDTFLKWLILSLWEKALCVTFHYKNIHWVYNIIQGNMKTCRTSK